MAVLGSAKAIGKDLGSSISGNIESAYITIHDLRKYSKDSSLSPDVVKTVMQFGSDSFKKTIAENKRFRVQFNPSELSVYSTTETLEKLGAQKKSEGKDDVLVESPIGSRLELSMNLIFDHMNISTAFMMEKNLMPTSVSGIVNIATTGNNKMFTVQTEVEGFIAALRNVYTQMVTFSWADFSFTGTLLHVGAQYTMFSMAGNPVRAKVSMRLRSEARGQNMSAWLDDFEKAFGGDQSSLVRPEQYASNLLNLNL